MIGKTNVNERNTRYRVGPLSVGATETHTFLPEDSDLDYFDEVNVIVTSGNPLKELCLDNTINFTPVELGYSITRVPDYIFYKVAGLREVNLPPAVTYIGHYAFYNSGATSLRLDTPLVTTVGTSALGNMISMTTAYINLPLISSTNNFLTGASNLEQLDLVAIQRLGDNFLYGAAKLARFTVPECCTSVGGRILDLNSNNYYTAPPIHVYFARHAVVDGDGNYTTSPSVLTQDAIGSRQVSKIYFHCPLDSFLAYRRQFGGTGSDNSRFLGRVYAYHDAVLGETLPASITQQAAGYVGTYNLTWYTDETHTTAYAGTVADEAKRYYAVASVVSETAI